MDIDLTTLTDIELHALSLRVNEEVSARQTMSSAEEELTRVAEQSQIAREKIAYGFISARDRQEVAEGNPPAWKAPTGAHDIYTAGYRVTHNGKIWVNHHPANSWEPGTTNSQWIEEVEEGEIDDPPVIEWGVGQQVFAGDLRSYSGRIWRAKVTHVTHEGWIPSADTYAVWTDLGPSTPTEEPTPPDESEVPEWSANATYEVGDQVTHNGKLWECLIAHGAEYQGTWAPGVASTVWREV